MEFKSNLDEVLREIEKAKKKKMVATGEYARNKVVKKLSGQRTGRTYKVPGTNTTYTASTPGQPPASATGGLRESIDYAFDRDDVIVGSPVKYAPMLEFGTYQMQPRPFLRPTLKENQRKLIDILSGRWFD